MATKAINFKFTGNTTPISSYDSTKTNLGSLIRQYTGALSTDKFAGPSKIGMARPMEQSTGISGIYPHVITFSPTIDWVFLSDNSTAASTRRIILYEYNKLTSEFNWKGFITLTFPTVTTHTIRGFRVSRELYTIGTVGVSGTTVTGSSTSWSSNRVSSGCRIGFGSNDPTQISDWYEISSVDSNTSISLSTTIASTITSGTPYVIEDIIIITANLNSTATNGGLFITKGIRPEIFTPIGTVIPSATTVDNIRSVYWLADSSVVTNTAPAGTALGNITSWTDQIVYILNVGVSVYAYNFRAPLTLVSGKDITSNVVKTGIQLVTGVISIANNGRVGTLLHGPGNGIESLYFVTTTRVYRAEISGITNGSTTWQSDNMVEIPPGGLTTYLATGAMTACELSSGIDRLAISTTGNAGARSYITRYNTVSNPFDHIFLADDKQQDQSSSDGGSVPHPAILAAPFSFWSEGGILYLARVGTTAALNQIYTLPIGSHWTYAVDNSELLITPKFDISDSSKLYNIYVNDMERLGSDTFSLPTEPYRIYYRTSGISDNSGVWILIDDNGDLSSVNGTEIQFAFSFKVIGTTCVPSRILGLGLIYEDKTTDTHYQPSVANSNINLNIFSYRQSINWGTNIPDMRMKLYNAVTGSLILDDTILSSTYGTWEYSSDNGTTWNTWLNTADVVGNYIRYTATSLPGGTRIKALLTQA